MRKSEYKKIFSYNDWDMERLQIIFDLLDKKSVEYLGLDCYPNQFEIVSADELLNLYSSVGLPTNYPHWKFGKDYMINHNKYLKGRMGLSYEMIINSNPCISYNIEENDLCLMTLVYAHAACGHNHFFKNNYLFKEWTQADAIVDYMKFARNFILECEKKYGPDEVEEFLDCCHSIQNYGIDLYHHPKFSLKKEQDRIQKILKWEEENYNPIFDKDKKQRDYKDYDELDLNQLQTFLKEPQENILYFLEKFAPNISRWKRELIRIVRKVAQYFMPQSSTKTINEGTATFVHYYMINRLFDEGYLPDSFMIEFYKHHTNVVYQPTFDKSYYYGLNPYAVGFNIFMDIKRICENPTDEDKEYFPQLIGKNWIDEFKYTIANYRDDSFVAQYLSPKVIRDMKLFSYYDRADSSFYSITNIHDEQGYKKIREIMSRQYNRTAYIPNIAVYDYDDEEQILMLEYNMMNDISLNEDERDKVLDNIEYMWGGNCDIKYIK